MNKLMIFILISLMIFNSCNKTEREIEEKVIVIRTVKELTDEFANDYEAADNFYKNKKIEISGYIMSARRLVIELAEKPVVENPNSFVDSSMLIDFIENNLIVECELDKLAIEYNIRPDDKVVIQGDYKGVLISSNHKFKIKPLILLRNCIIVSVVHSVN